MHLILDTGEHVEGRMLNRDEVCIRGEIGGPRPALVHPDALVERAQLVADRRLIPRRVGPDDRRRNRRGDRRGKAAVYVGQTGRRWLDTGLSWESEAESARLTATLERRREQARVTPGRLP